MKTIKLLIPALFISLVSCQKEELLERNESQTTTNNNLDSRYYDEFTIYVMDSRYSRGTCSTGPGVCFKDSFGHIWDYNLFNLVSNPDVGPVGVTLAENQISLTFFRSLEEDVFIIEEDVTVNASLSRAFGKREIILKAGKYEVNYDENKYGKSKVKSIIK
jgi:hypothetical protein